jgi:glycosyltransferase involved in cell wall biosynthesis
MSPRIAIVVHKPEDTTKTFVRRHINELAPGKTALIYLAEDNTDTKSSTIPTHFAYLPEHHRGASAVDLPRKLIWFFRYGFTAALDNEEVGRIRTFIQKNGITKVMAEFGWVGCVISRALRKTSCQFFVHFHGTDASAALRKIHIRHGYRRLLSSCAGLICPSRFLADNLTDMGLPPERIHVIPYGIDVRRFAPSKHIDPNLLLSVGRFVPKKAPHLAIQAFSGISKVYPDARLEMIGDGELLNDCKNLAERLGIKDRVVFHGVRDHGFVREKMGRASIFVQHSVTALNGDTEGLPVAILEAMSSGTPVVATRHSGIPEAVIDGETGFLVDEKDVDGMAGKIGKLLGDEKLRSSMGDSARNRVLQHFSAEKEIHSLRELMGIEGF